MALSTFFHKETSYDQTRRDGDWVGDFKGDARNWQGSRNCSGMKGPGEGDRPKSLENTPCIYPLPFIFGTLSTSLIMGESLAHSKTHGNIQASRATQTLEIILHTTATAKYTCTMQNRKAQGHRGYEAGPSSSADNFLLNDTSSKEVLLLRKKPR